MNDNVFDIHPQNFTLSDYLNFNENNRRNLGNELPIAIYRLLEYSLREQIIEQFGHEAQVSVFRQAGYKAGVAFSNSFLDLSLPVNEFIAQLQARLSEMKIGVIRIESIDDKAGKIILTVAEDADCSGLPLLGETVCNYNEGFISAVLSTYTKKDYIAVEVDCWATGERICRFKAEIKE